MNRLAVLLSLFTTACLGSLTGGDTDPPVQPPPPPEPVTDVTMRVLDGAMPQAGVKVIFQAADDTVIADVVTDANGRAWAKMPAGGAVTVIRTYSPSLVGEPGPIDHVYTYAGVKPGDNLELSGALRDETPYLAKITVGLDAGSIVGVMTPCGSAYGQAPTIDVPLKGCGTETDFFVIDYSGEVIDEDTGETSGPQYFAAHATLAPMIDFSNETFRGTLSTQYSASNAMGAVSLQKRLVIGSFTVFDSGQIPTTTATVDVPELPNTEQIVSAYVNYEGRLQVISQRAAFSPSAVTVDVSASMIPSSSTPVLSGNTLSWSQSGSGTPDLALVSLTVGAVGRQFVHSVASAYSGMSMRIPSLPAPHDRYNVQSTDTPQISHNLASVTGGYDGARSRVFNHQLADIAPMGGIAAASVSQSGQPGDNKP